MFKVQSTSPMIILFTLMLVLASCPYTAVAPSGGSMGGGDSSGGGSSSDNSYSSTMETYHRYSTSRSDKNDGSDQSGNPLVLFFFVVAFILFSFLYVHQSYKESTQQTSVIKLQVLLDGAARSFQRDLDAIARQADTSKRSGYEYILKESANALLRQSDYWLSSYLSVELKKGTSHAKILFKELSNEERDKFDKETLTNMDNYRRERTMQGAAGPTNPFILVTFLLATIDLLHLPSINTRKDLQAVLRKFSAISESGILAANVLWTPQQENDCLTQQKLLLDYPLLKQLNF